jgi:xanthine dehydrogenase small subunit
MKQSQSYIEFILNGKVRKIEFYTENISPTTTLLQYLRSLPDYKGTKEGCAEGDCGACTVVLAELSLDGRLQYKAVNSCLIFLPMVHNKQVITVNDLEQDGKMHPIQQAYYDFHASQCGYCTPGFIMATFPIYKSSLSLNEKEIRHNLAGNLCRCTGYKPIIDASLSVCTNPAEDKFTNDEKRIEKLLKEIKIRSRGVHLSINDQQYYLPNKLNDALAYLAKNSRSIIISGATDIALRVTKKHEKLSNILDLSQVPELKFFYKNEKKISIGAGLSLSQIENLIHKEFPALSEMLYWFGSVQIRNLATLGGNIGSASPIGDSLPVLLAYNAHVVLKSIDGAKEVSLENFISGYRKTILADNQIISEIIIPIQEKATLTRFYKNSKRKDLDISTVSAAFRLKLKENKVAEIALYFGGMAATPVRALKTETFLTKKAWTKETVEKSMSILSEEFAPISDARAEAKGRINMAGNLLLKFCVDTMKSRTNE